ncbi:MAG: hypothetical protein PHE02_09770 [Lachnospiraceae bacterium]|nr:hypothetical protein [Lachnospiraceae bacterium]
MNESTQKAMSSEQKHKTEVIKPQREYKDRLFRMIFRDKKELLSLYNAMHTTSYNNPDDLIITTLENAIYMNVKNDLSFMISDWLSLYEHQSTYNPNIPLRNLGYVADVYSRLTADENLYGKATVKIPPPQFVVFYNGVEEQPERKIMKLSDAYKISSDDPNLELKVLVLNINPGYNTELMEKCKTLKDYMRYVDCVRTYAKNMTLSNAVERAVNECIKNDILAEFLKKYKTEAMKVSIYEYDEEKHMQQIFAEGRDEGRTEGKTEGKAEEQKNGIHILVNTCKSFNASRDTTFQKIKKEYGLSDEEVEQIMTEYWK